MGEGEAGEGMRADGVHARRGLCVAHEEQGTRKIREKRHRRWRIGREKARLETSGSALYPPGIRYLASVFGEAYMRSFIAGIFDRPMEALRPLFSRYNPDHSLVILTAFCFQYYYTLRDVLL